MSRQQHDSAGRHLINGVVEREQLAENNHANIDIKSEASASGTLSPEFECGQSGFDERRSDLTFIHSQLGE